MQTMADRFRADGDRRPVGGDTRYALGRAFMARQALILADGDPRPGVANTPTSLTDTGGAPLLTHLTRNLRRHGVESIIHVTGAQTHATPASSRTDPVPRVAPDTSHPATSPFRMESRRPDHTVDRLCDALPLLEERCFVVDGARLFDCNYLDLALRLRDGAQGALALRRVDDCSPFGEVRLEGDAVVEFVEQWGVGPGLASGGVCALTRDALQLLPEGASSIERDLLPLLAAQGLLRGVVYAGFFLDGETTPHDRAQARLARWMRKPCVFFDRDGVLNEDLGYVHTPSQFYWSPGAMEAVKWCNDAGWLTAVVTNQSGIARGYYDEAAFLELCAWMQEELRSRGAHLDAIHYCPHHPTVGTGLLRRECLCRKPAPGMLRQAAAELEADLARSILVGDKTSDLEAAAACGVRGHLFHGGSLLDFVRQRVRPLL